MHITAIIPARYGSTSLTCKPLRLIAGKSLIQRVFEATINTGLFDQVIVATDHLDIMSHLKTFGADGVMTDQNHQTGTDRIEEVARGLQTDLIINVQGDEPFICKEPLRQIISAFDDQKVQVTSIMSLFTNPPDIYDPSCVKVVVDIHNDAIYFSRSVIPFDRDNVGDAQYYKHFGVYAYRPDMLKKFVSLPAGTLEKIERLEQLRLLENGYKIRMVLTEYEGIGIDTKEDIEKAEKMLS